jgi:hypothetical protein
MSDPLRNQEIPMTQALTLAAIMLAMVLFTQLGRRHFGLHSILMPLGTVSFFGWEYLHGLPTTGGSIALAVAGTLIGVVSGLIALATIRVERDAAGKGYTRAGAAYLIVWLVVLAGRIAFVYGMQHSTSFAHSVGTFSMHHQLVSQSWVAFFVLMAISMVAVRSAGVALRLTATRTTADRSYSLAA